jgi:MoxR-like ATPase
MDTNPSATFEQTVTRISLIREEVRKVFFGQDTVLDQVLAAFFASGHVLIEGKPGLGKTHLVLALAHTFGGAFRRIQFTPDLMPSDVTGHTLYDMAAQQFRLRKGPAFTNLLRMRSTERRPKRNPRCWRSCRSGRSRSTERVTRCRRHS